MADKLTGAEPQRQGVEALPTGTVTFLLTDIAGSTRLLRADRDAYAAALAEHRRLLRAAFAAHGGWEVDTQGDSFFVAFPTAGQAVAAAATAQRSLAETPVHVRMGVHTGEATIVGDGYVGLAVHRAARIAAAASGGQVLLSDATAAVVGEELPPGTALRDLGAHRLKDFPRPAVLYQLDVDGLPTQFPPPRTLSPPTIASPTNLPRRSTSFVGRARELMDVAAALDDAALVTLIGAGGVGKSRLALGVAEAEQARFADGVWLCELAPLPDEGPVAHAVAACLRVQQRHGLTIEETVVEYLRPRQLLLVLDNCEHVLEAGARLLAQVIAHCPRVSVLATSREPLRVEGEQIWPVPSLAQSEAATLFVQRAQAASPGFRLDRANDGAVAEICRRLDGLPLAIELVAAQMRIMSAAEMASRLDDERLRVPGSRTAQPRHQSLTAAITWSYRLLTDRQQQLFARLSVFRGAADFAAVHAVCAEPDDRESDTLDLLTALVDKSMVVAERYVADTRYRLLETLRAFGRERLPSDSALPRRHARYFIALAEVAAAGMRGPEEQNWVDRTMPDLDDLRAAFQQVLADGETDLVLRLVTSLPEVLFIRVGYEASGWAEQALALAPVDHPLFVACVGAAARGAWNMGDFPRACRLARRAGGRSPGRGTARIAYPGDVLADIDLFTGNAESALRHYEAQLDLARRDGEPIRLVWTLYYVAICHAVRRTPALGLPVGEESMQVAEPTANPTARSMARYALGLVLKKSAPERALALFDEAADLAASVHNFWWQGIALMEAAATRAVHDDPVSAARALGNVLDHWDRVGDWTQQWLNLRYIVRLLVRLGSDEDAVVLHHCLRAADKPSPLDAARLEVLRDRLGPRRYAAAGAQGSSLSGAAAVVYARTALCAA